MNTHTQVCTQQGAQIWLHKICCYHGTALHLLTLPWKHKNDDWHGALSEMGQEHPGQVKSNQLHEPQSPRPEVKKLPENPTTLQILHKI